MAAPADLFAVAPTPAAWAVAQLGNLSELLVEQAHLEKKAAAAAVQFLFRIHAGPDLHRALSTLAREELVHFERTLRLLQQRGIGYGPQPPGAYAERLKAHLAREMPARLVDELLVAACIEARSHERLLLLAAACAPGDPELAAFYGDLAEAEQRHAPTYFDAACSLLPHAEVVQRQVAWRQREAAVLRSLPFAPRLHSGWQQAGHG